MTTSADYSALDPGRLEDWAAELGKLLNAAGDCLRSGSDACRKKCMEDLREFIEWNAFQTLDKIAADTVQDLVAATVGDALEAIGKRTGDLQRYSKDIRKVASEASKDASAIRLEAVTRVLDASTQTIRAMSSLRDALKGDSDAAQLVSKIEDLVKKTQALRDELERK